VTAERASATPRVPAPPPDRLTRGKARTHQEQRPPHGGRCVVRLCGRHRAGLHRADLPPRRARRTPPPRHPGPRRPRLQAGMCRCCSPGWRPARPPDCWVRSSRSHGNPPGPEAPAPQHQPRTRAKTSGHRAHSAPVPRSGNRGGSFTGGGITGTRDGAGRRQDSRRCVGPWPGPGGSSERMRPGGGVHGTGAIHAWASITTPASPPDLTPRHHNPCHGTPVRPLVAEGRPFVRKSKNTCKRASQTVDQSELFCILEV